MTQSPQMSETTEGVEWEPTGLTGAGVPALGSFTVPDSTAATQVEGASPYGPNFERHAAEALLLGQSEAEQLLARDLAIRAASAAPSGARDPQRGTGIVSNIAAAMKGAVRRAPGAIKDPVGDPDAPARAQTLIRSTEAEKESWAEAAEATGQSVAKMTRDLLNAEAERILVCDHPADRRRTYPWSDVCLECGTRLK